MPWSSSKPVKVEKPELSRKQQREIERFARQSSKVMEKMDKQRKDTLKKASMTMAEFGDRRKESMKAASYRMPTRRELKDLAEHGEVVMRRQSYVEKLPFGERRETIIERVPLKK